MLSFVLIAGEQPDIATMYAAVEAAQVGAMHWAYPGKFYCKGPFGDFSIDHHDDLENEFEPEERAVIRAVFPVPHYFLVVFWRPEGADLAIKTLPAGHPYLTFNDYAVVADRDQVLAKIARGEDWTNSKTATG